MWFAVLMAVNAQTLPTLMTLNKEILAVAGLVAFSAYLYSGLPKRSRRGSKLLLLVAIVLSTMARWQQLIILLWYIVAEWKRSPLRNKPRKAIIALLLVCSVGYAAAIHVLHVNISGFLVQTTGGGTIVRLDDIQGEGGYFLVAAPKILMNLAGRLVTPAYFLHDYWYDNFGGSWQNQFIGFLSNFAMVGIIAVAFFRDRLRLTRPLIHLAFVYFICTAVNPFIQPRYMYPGYSLLALELSRKKSAIEAVRPHRGLLPPLPPSYRLTPSMVAAAQHSWSVRVGKTIVDNVPTHSDNESMS